MKNKMNKRKKKDIDEENDEDPHVRDYLLIAGKCPLHPPRKVFHRF